MQRKIMDNTILQTKRKIALVAGWSLIALAILAGFAYGYLTNTYGLE